MPGKLPLPEEGAEVACMRLRALPDNEAELLGRGCLAAVVEHCCTF